MARTSLDGYVTGENGNFDWATLDRLHQRFALSS